MKIAAISDIHGSLYPNIPECEVLCLCGDIVPLNIQRNDESSKHWFENQFKKWIESLPCEKVLLVPGNHDFYLYELYTTNKEIGYEEFESMYNGKLTLLIDDEFTYKGVKFFGTPWISPIGYQRGKWAFELFDTKTAKENPAENIDDYEMIPTDTTVLLTHDNPNYNKLLREKIDHCNNLQAHFFGHWHDGIAYGDLKQYNCSLLNDSYYFREYKHIVCTDVENK